MCVAGGVSQDGCRSVIAQSLGRYTSAVLPAVTSVMTSHDGRKHTAWTRRGGAHGGAQEHRVIPGDMEWGSQQAWICPRTCPEEVHSELANCGSYRKPGRWPMGALGLWLLRAQCSWGQGAALLGKKSLPAEPSGKTPHPPLCAEARVPGPFLVTSWQLRAMVVRAGKHPALPCRGA